MPNGRLTRRTRPRTARGFAALCVTLAVGAGCQRFPLRYAEVTPESTAKATTRVEPHAGPPAALAPFLSDAPTVPPAAAEGPGPGPPARTEPAPETKDAPPGADTEGPSGATPLIDQALKRASVSPQPAAGGPAPAEEAVELPPAGGPAANAPEAEKPEEPAIPKEFEPSPAETSAGPPPVPLDLGPKTDDGQAAPVKSGPKPIDVEKPADPAAAAGDEWREGLTRVRELARERAGEPGDAAQAWAIRSRVLDWLAGEGPEPAGQTGRVWNSVLATLATATGSETPDEPALAFHLGAAVEALESYAPMQITALSFCRKIDGFGHYDPVEAPAVRAGQPLLVYCEMAGLRYESDDGGFRSRLSSQVEVLPAGGGKVVWSEALGTAEDVCRRRRRDYFVNYRLVVPAKLAPGSYSLRLSQTDLVSNRSVSGDLPFSVQP